VEARILDTTLRDGTNAIDLGFNEDDVRQIAGRLAAAGVEWIEVGHGVSVGLGPTWPQPVVPDARAVELARGAAPNARIGAVLVPALVDSGALPAVVEQLDFVRLAPGPGMLEDCLPWIESLSGGGTQVFLQLVKTHTYTLASLRERVRPLCDAGLSGLYVVDTAGCMTPDSVGRYVAELVNGVSLPVGFHGHNNSGLAIACSLAAVEAGASYVDATIGGIGRGAGNTQIEVLAWLLQARGMCTDVHIDTLFEASHALWHRFPNAARGVDPVEAFYAMLGWDALSKEAALSAAQGLERSPFAFIRQLTNEVSGPWITGEHVTALAERLRARPGSAHGAEA
jgi:4-hydroxy 2-oxovalerate aldolase